ncbi:MAG: allantoin racemase [Paracoccaceae bacterium]|jgi:allantoin racemase
MRIAVINPNATRSMTEKIVVAARAASPLDVEIEGRTCVGAPASIQGPDDGDAALPFVLEQVAEAEAGGADACIIACFDDTGLFLARRAANIPVIGIGEAAFHVAMLLGHRFSVVTTLSISVPVIEANIVAYGLESHCARVRASEVPVLDLEKPGSDARIKVSDEVARALVEDNAGAIVLGCAGMADLAADLAKQHGAPVIDGVAAACGMAAALVRLGPGVRPRRRAP